ncbi:putative leucine-rich repeat protein [Leishmania major strain Friedlin]|uniref:Putative leucine-rich repeat protein n=1 Tax=Leishmania major TaxID=5664 RepID=Q4QHX1_LEIMA|nr:putative leucine-rich repeat protein [Leishmania major strain Friedlin]CAG9569668.1 leucine-rich_repeat_protein_-__putative [Leishmania major strain Friedlin]CAJ02557.1 putative leucine-rich repeat protein [Leishmania major strain Friedlin]|eukprot:XP_001681227.1 putative leucine-rich repeat protein [Leishmania major strain Friedlin]
MASTSGSLYRSRCSISSLAEAPLAKATALSEQRLPRTPTPPPARALPAIAAAATVTAATLPSIPLDRYRAKLEECAELHRQLEELAQTKEAVEQRLASCQAEAVQLRQTVHRLECVVQLRNEELVLLRDYRRQRGGGGGDGALASMRMVLPAAEAAAQSLDRARGGAGQQFTHAAEGAAAADQAVILEYIRTSCYVGCPTHPQLIQSFFAASSGEALVATEPPLTYAQGSVLHRLLTQTPIGWGAAAAAAAAVAELSAFRTWACEHLRTFSVRFEDAYAGVSILSDALLHSLPSLAQLEVWGVDSDAALTKLADALVGATQVRELSLPELVVGDEGLQALWRLLRIRGSMHAPCTAAVPAETSCAADSLALALCTLDLSACHIKDPLTLAQLHCPSVEVLLLPPTDRVTDSFLAEVLQRCPRLHTLDLSGCARLTDACVEFFNSAAPQLRVLALEHCPHVHRLQLDHVEVLLSSLAHVHALTSRSLRVLPLPVQQRVVLTSLVAPRLSQISLHGLPVDEEVLRRLNGRSGEVDGCEQGVRLTSVTFSECTFVSDDVFAGFLQSQTDLQKLSLFHCKGLSNACWVAKRGLPIFAALHTLELVNLRTLTDEALRELTQACPALQQLNLHGAGWSHLTDISIRQLDQLSELRVLNLLALNPDLVTAPVVTALVQRLPQLQRLYHETAITLAGHSKSVESGDRGALHPVGAVDITSASVSSSVIVERSDAEARWRAALRDYPLRMLRLQHHSALVLWTDGARTAEPRASREGVAQATGESLLTATTVDGGHDGSGIRVAEAAAVAPSKLFPAMATRTMAAAIAASAASTLTLPSLKAPAPPQHGPPGEVRLGDAEGAPHASGCLVTSPQHEAALLPPLRRSTPGDPAHMDADECDQASPVHEQQQLDSPSSCSSSSSSTYTRQPTQEGSHKGAGHSLKRSLVQCANAAASAAFQPYQHRPVRMSTGSSRPPVTATVTAAAASAQAGSVEDHAEASMGPWEE